MYFCHAAGVIVGTVRNPLTTDELLQQPEEVFYIMPRYTQI